MRRFLRPQNLVPVAIIAAVAAMVAYANLRDEPRRHAPHTMAPPMGAAGAPKTSREELERRVADREARLAKKPDDNGAALPLAARCSGRRACSAT